MGEARPCKNCGGTKRDKYGKCIPCERARQKKWQAENRDKHQIADSRWKDANRERHRGNAKNQYERNPEKKIEQARQWAKDNPQSVIAKSHRRRARKAGNGGSYTAAEWQAIVKNQNGLCLCCGKKSSLTVDHIVPIAKGGSNNANNLQGLCRSCNSKKGTNIIDYRPKAGVLQWLQKKLFG